MNLDTVKGNVSDFIQDFKDGWNRTKAEFEAGNNSGFNPSDKGDVKFMGKVAVYGAAAQLTVGAVALVAGAGFLKAVGCAILAGGTVGVVMGVGRAIEKGKELL